MKNNRKRIIVSLLALFLMVSGTAYGQSGQGLLSFGPIDTGPLGIFPSYYMDKDGLALEACLDSPFCLGTTTGLNAVGGEAFYWSATANLANNPVGPLRLFEMALEMAWLNEQPIAAEAMVFNRLRIRLFSLPFPGNYTISHPYGTLVLPAVDDGKGGLEINFTDDFPGTIGIQSFQGALRAPYVGPFLRARAKTDRPAGFIGDGATPTTVTGGPFGNSVSVTGPNGFFRSTNLFAIEGKKATNGGLSGVKASFTRNAANQKVVTIRASSIGKQNITAVIGPAPPAKPRFLQTLAPLPGSFSNYSKTVVLGANAVVNPVTVTNNTDASQPFIEVPCTDVVTISQATWVAGIPGVRASKLTVVASSSDAPTATLSLVDINSGTVLAEGTGGTLNVTINTPFKPARVRVTSSSGGQKGTFVR